IRTVSYIRKSLHLLYSMLGEFSTISSWTPERNADFILKYHRIFKIVRKEGTVHDRGTSHIHDVCKSVMKLTVLLEWYNGRFAPFFEEREDDVMFWRAMA
ncbi:MAG: hypothetical protein QMC37_04870, partial [Flavobacteriales bacterium]